MSPQRKYAPGHSKQPIQIIQFVNLREDDASSQILPGGIPLAVILVRMPTWQVLADFRPYRQNPANFLLLNKLVQALQAGMETHLIADHGCQAAAFHQADQFVHLFQAVRKWFLDKQGATLPGCPDCRRDMQTGGITNESRLWLLRQGLFDIRKEAQVVFFLQACPCFNLELVGQDRWIGTGIICHDIQIITSRHP